MKLPVVKKTATGQPSTDEEVLEELALDYPLPKVLLEHRALSKLKSTYTDKLPRMVNPRTGRVHTTFSQATAVTGRLASNDPNLQNIPVRTAEGRRIREAFIAPAGPRASCRPTTRRSSCASWPTSRGDAALLARLRTRARTSTARPPPRSSACRRRGDRRAAPLRQGGQLRPDLRHERLRAGAASSASSAARRSSSSTSTSQRYPGVAALHGAHARARPRAGLRRDRVRPPPVAARHQGGRRTAPRGGRARGDQRADAGHRRRPHQAGDDRRAATGSTRRSSRRGWCCRSTTSSCSRCREASSRASKAASARHG